MREINVIPAKCPTAPPLSSRRSGFARNARRRWYRVTAALGAGIGGRSQSPNAIATTGTVRAIGMAT
ncbi:MAG: hypothetical protein ACXVHK_30665 [Solirubrobacteraceae bacterium]